MDDQSKNVNCCEVEDFTQKKITAKEHHKWYDPWCLIFGVIMCTLGSIIGMELIVRTGVTANTSIIGALFAVVLSLIFPCAFSRSSRASTGRIFCRPRFPARPSPSPTACSCPSAFP